MSLFLSTLSKLLANKTMPPMTQVVSNSITQAPQGQNLPAPDISNWIRQGARNGAILEIQPFVNYLKQDFMQLRANLDTLQSSLTTDDQKAILNATIQNMNYDIAVQVFDHVINLK